MYAAVRRSVSAASVGIASSQVCSVSRLSADSASKAPVVRRTCAQRQAATKAASQRQCAQSVRGRQRKGLSAESSQPGSARSAAGVASGST